MNPYDINDIAQDNIRRKACGDRAVFGGAPQPTGPVRFNDTQFGITPYLPEPQGPPYLPEPTSVATGK